LRREEKGAFSLLDILDGELVDWIRAKLPEAQVMLGYPSEKVTRATVCLYLLELSHALKPRGEKPPPIEIGARYLVTVSAKDTSEQHRIMAILLHAALSKPELEMPKFDVAVEPPPLGLWAQLNLMPQPSFFISAPIRYERDIKPAAPVEELRLTHVAIRPLVGSVSARFTGRDGVKRVVPLAGARVEVPSFRLSAITNSDGRFRFAGVPGMPSIALRVIARGRVKELIAPLSSSTEESLSVDVDMDMEEVNNA
jgi:hypothetical protein